MNKGHTVKAAFITTPGPAESIQYGELPKPQPGPKQVLVRTEAVAVNPIDTYVRNGNVKFTLPNPYVVGCDVAGIVEEAGAGCSWFKVGDRVWGSNQGLFGRQGTFADFCAIAEEWLYPAPPSVSAETLAAVALVGITAHLGLFFHAELKPGEVVFVNGGTGGVGSMVVQMAKAAGATVITTAGSKEKADECRRLGATHVIEWRTEDVAQRLTEITSTTGPINVWFETLRTPDLDRTIPLMAMRGRIILMAGRDARPVFTLGAFYTKDLKALGFAMFNATQEEQRSAAMEINRMLASGDLIAKIDRILPLSEAAKAHRLQEDNTLSGANTLGGKIVLKP
jgi:NADPH2:quinone reductase